MLEGTQKQRTLRELVPIAGVQQPMLMQEVLPLPQISRKPELISRLQRTGKIVEVVNSARAGLKVRSGVTPFQAEANVLQFGIEAGPARDLCNSLTYRL